MKRLAWLLILVVAVPVWGEPKPKYGPEAVLLRDAPEYIRENRAPDYWALAPYYAAQFNDRACTAAAISMVVNGARVRQKLTADDKLVTQQALLEKVAPGFWQKFIGPDPEGLVMSLEKIGELAGTSLKAYGIEGTSVETVRTADLLVETRRKLHRALVENERSDRDFILLNFIQGVYTGDADAGHVAVVGGYDAKRKRALVFDPDREWYEPYWVSEQTLLKGMTTQDKSTGKNRGYLWIKFP